MEQMIIFSFIREPEGRGKASVFRMVCVLMQRLCSGALYYSRGFVYDKSNTHLLMFPG